MDSKSQNFDLTQDQKSRLLKLGCRSKSHERSPDNKQRKTDMLYDVINGPLPVDPSLVNSLPVVVRGLSSRLRSLAGERIGNLLQNPATDITTITRIKQYAKESGTSTDSEDTREIFLAVYYAAIASALLFHNEKITQHSYKDLEQFFWSFMKKDWVIDEIKGILGKAQAYCAKMTNASNGQDS